MITVRLVALQPMNVGSHNLMGKIGRRCCAVTLKATMLMKTLTLNVHAVLVAQYIEPLAEAPLAIPTLLAAGRKKKQIDKKKHIIISIQFALNAVVFSLSLIFIARLRNKHKSRKQF